MSSIVERWKNKREASSIKIKVCSAFLKKQRDPKFIESIKKELDQAQRDFVVSDFMIKANEI